LIKEVRTVLTDASAESVYRSFTSIGGDKGWLAWSWAWKLRGFLDQIVGGPGLSRGRRHPTELLIGEELDFWRVEDLKKNELMLLRAEMKVPGKAWLQFEAVPKDGKTQLIQTAMFAPKGLLGFLYWYASYPAHFFIFERIAKKIAQGAEVLEGTKRFWKCLKRFILSIFKQKVYEYYELVNWLKDLVEINLSAQELAEKLTDAGLAVEGIHEFGR
jgi:hypothetical protein